MRLYNFRRNQSAWGSKSDMSHRSRGPKIYQGDKGQGWTQTTQLTVNGDETSAPSAMSHSHKNIPECVTEPEREALQESRTQARTRVYRAEKELGAELLTSALVKKHTSLQLQGRRSHKTALTISSQKFESLWGYPMIKLYKTEEFTREEEKMLEQSEKDFIRSIF